MVHANNIYYGFTKANDQEADLLRSEPKYIFKLMRSWAFNHADDLSEDMLNDDFKVLKIIALHKLIEVIIELELLFEKVNLKKDFNKDINFYNDAIKAATYFSELKKEMIKEYENV